MCDTGCFDSNGFWDVGWFNLDEPVVPGSLDRLIYNANDVDESSLASLMLSLSEPKPDLIGLSSPSCWNGCVRNVPTHPQVDAASLGRHYAIYVRRILPGEPGPVLVLSRLRYRGNVGSIVRSAVQANIFEAIYLIDSEVAVLQKDIDYYSMMNSFLIPIVRFASVGEFLSRIDGQEPHHRTIIVTALNDTSVNIFDRGSLAPQILSKSNVYVVFGSENEGLDDSLLSHDRAVSIRIPSMSSSINVSSAFSVVCTAMIMYRQLSE